MFQLMGKATCHFSTDGESYQSAEHLADVRSYDLDLPHYPVTEVFPGL